MGVDEGLYRAALRKLRITYEDEDTEALVREIAGQAEGELRYALGIPAGEDAFSEPGAERSLLLNLIFYEFNDAADEFWANYAARVAQARERWAVMEFAAEESQAADV